MFNLTATNASKGVALMLILWHHLFYEHSEYGMLVYMTALLAKVCVAIFVILSGYGLSESIKNKKVGLFEFYKKRLTKLYLNYWLIVAVFVPVGILYMDRSLVDAFGNHEYIKFAIQMSGFHMFLPVGYGYNATWWFMSLIVALYLLFPLIYVLVKKFGLWFIAFTFLILFLPDNYLGLLQNWILPFALGIFISRIDGFVVMMSWLKQIGIVRFVVLIGLMILVALFRQYGYVLTGVKIDWLFGIIIILFTAEIINLSDILKNILAFIGLHSFNIFLFHTFIYYYYWPDMIYFFHEPIVIFLSLLLISLIVSISLEYMKKLLLFDELYKYIVHIKIHDRIFIYNKPDNNVGKK